MAKAVAMELAMVLCAALVSGAMSAMGDCDCMTTWDYDGNNDSTMETYEGCSATADWDQTWCYVEGGSNCNQYQNSSVAGETRKWRECGTCNCLYTWDYDGDNDSTMETYDGCSATADWDQTWCYVQGGENCNQYQNSSVAGETRKWRECGTCNCMTEWNYDGDADGVFESYEGCSATADWAQTWCYVQGGTNCNQYQDSSVSGETRKWRECESCNCMTEWNYDGDEDGVFESYEGCSATLDWDQTWCYVQGGTNCDGYQDSTVSGETRKWRECEPSPTPAPCADDDERIIELASNVGQTISGCAIVQSYCADVTYGSIMQTTCPATCGSCRRLAEVGQKTEELGISDINLFYP